MLPKTHIISGVITSIVLLIFFPQKVGILGASIIFLSSVLIDVDHYLYYLVKNKDWSLKAAYSWFITKKDLFLKIPKEDRKNYQMIIMIFHGIECWLLIILLIIVNKIFLFVLIGIIIHMIFDFIDLLENQIPIYTKTSQIYTFIRNKKKKKM